MEPSIDLNGAELLQHILWALSFLMVYATSEDIHCAIVGWPHEDIYQKWSWHFVKKIFDLQEEIIVLQNRFLGQPQCPETGEYRLNTKYMVVYFDWVN